MKLSDKRAVVTGAGRGIGKGCALELAREGADLVINDRPGSPDVAQTAEEIRDLGRNCTVVTEDVFARAGCERVMAVAVQELGGIDILVSNPAVGHRSDFLQYDPDDFERVIRGTLTAGFHISQLAARHMVQQGSGGKIIFISSVQALMPLARCVAYGAAKAGLNHMAETIAVELSGQRINVNVIEPGWIDTPGERETFDAQRMGEEGRRLPWGRLGTPIDIGRAAAFLASDDADYITGAVLRVDGGFWFKDCCADQQIREKHASSPSPSGRGSG